MDQSDITGDRAPGDCLRSMNGLNESSEFEHETELVSDSEVDRPSFPCSMPSFNGVPVGFRREFWLSVPSIKAIISYIESKFILNYMYMIFCIAL